MRLAAVNGALGVALGAFGAHGLRNLVDDPRLLEVWETGARYHLVHAVALLAVSRASVSPWVARLWIAGIVLFSGSLYAMTLTGVRALGAITPLGGVCLIGGWLALALRPTSDGRA